MTSSQEESKSSRGNVQLIDWTSANEIDIKHIFMSIGKDYLGKKFIITPGRSDIITELMKYFTGNESQFDLGKGVYIYGDYGVGKSALMAIIQRTIATCFPFSVNGFMAKSLEDIIDEYKEAGNLDSITYRKHDKPKHLCINEFGKTMDDKIYGTRADSVIHSLFMIRYQLFQDSGILTHATSNYSVDNAGAKPIVMDRMIEMFNFVKLTGNSFRR